MSIAGYILVLLLYCIYRRLNYYNGSYIKFTQNLYATKAYRIVGNLISIFAFLIILIGIFLLISYGYDWTQYIVALLLIVMESRSLLLEKSNGLDINSERFRMLEICHGSGFVRVINFLVTSNAVLLDELEVQVMSKGLPGHVSAPEKRDEGCCSCFDWYPLSDKSIDDFLAAGRNVNIGHENNATV